MDIKELYPAIEAADHAMAVLSAPALQTSATNLGLTPQETHALLAVPTFSPIPVTAGLLNIRIPYNSRSHYTKLLNSLVFKEMLENPSQDQFTLTRKGLDGLKYVIHTIYAALAGMRPMDELNLSRLADQLQQCSEYCLATSPPPETWSISHLRRLAPGDGADTMVRIDQYLSELVAYRDDAHLAAWKGYRVSGHAWEILTNLWIERSLSLNQVCTKLKHRGFSRKQTRAAIKQLQKKGWAELENDALQITIAGDETRLAAENLTDRYYYAPFTMLGDSEIEILLELLNQHRRGIPHPA